SGTGPFHIEDWQPGKKLTLAAEENHWRDRGFVDAIEVEMGENFREQLNELELGRADLVELVALAFSSDPKTADEKLIRSALAHSIDRSSMKSVLLQGAGQPAASLLPNWMSGYGFVFSTDVDLKEARHERDQVRDQIRTAANWTVGYDANDSSARVLVERVALNAKDAGLGLQPTTAATSD